MKKAILSIILLIIFLTGIFGIWKIAFQSSQETPIANFQDQQSLNNGIDVIDMISFSGKTETGIGYTIYYPSDWNKFVFSCNATGIAFWPPNSTPKISGSGCGADSFLNSAPIILSTMSDPHLQLIQAKYKNVYDQMSARIIYHSEPN